MHFENNVLQAVQLSLQRTCPLVVVIGNTDDKLIENAQKIESDDVVALHLLPNSTEYGQFTALFTVNTIPCIVQVHNGQVLDTITEFTDLQQLYSKLCQNLTLKPLETTTHESSDKVNTSTAQSSHTNNASSSKQVASSSSSSSSPSSNRSTIPTNQNKNKRASSTPPNTQNPQTASREKYRLEILKKQKQDRLERERIKKEFESARREREALKKEQERLRNSTTTNQGQKKEQDNQDMLFKKKKQDNKNDITGVNAALSIRLFDGSAVKHVFKATDSLDTVRKWLDKNRTDGKQAYSFHQSFPKHSFGEGEEQQTLRELKLAPSATLILKPAAVENVFDAQESWSVMGSRWINQGNRLFNNVVSSLWGYEPIEGGEEGSENVQQEPQQQKQQQQSVGTEKPTNETKGKKDDKDKKITDNGNSLGLEDNNDKKND